MGVCSRYLTTLEVSMNAFIEHHKDSIQLGYRCFDRILLNGVIQPFQQPERVLGFFNAYRDGKRVTRRTLTEIADQFQYWLKNRSDKWGAPILEPSDGAGDDSRRDKFMDPYFENAKPNQVVAILKAREPARILVAIGDKDNDSPHTQTGDLAAALSARDCHGEVPFAPAKAREVRFWSMTVAARPLLQISSNGVREESRTQPDTSTCRRPVKLDYRARLVLKAVASKVADRVTYSPSCWVVLLP